MNKIKFFGQKGRWSFILKSAKYHEFLVLIHIDYDWIHIRLSFDLPLNFIGVVRTGVESNLEKKSSFDFYLKWS